MLYVWLMGIVVVIVMLACMINTKQSNLVAAFLIVMSVLVLIQADRRGAIDANDAGMVFFIIVCAAIGFCVLVLLARLAGRKRST